jgi:hypothetical protein
MCSLVVGWMDGFLRKAQYCMVSLGWQTRSGMGESRCYVDGWVEVCFSAVDVRRAFGVKKVFAPLTHIVLFTHHIRREVQRSCQRSEIAGRSHPASMVERFEFTDRLLSSGRPFTPCCSKAVHTLPSLLCRYCVASKFAFPQEFVTFEGCIHDGLIAGRCEIDRMT